MGFWKLHQVEITIIKYCLNSDASGVRSFARLRMTSKSGWLDSQLFSSLPITFRSAFSCLYPEALKVNPHQRRP
jgi:hypothetical protein